MTNKFMHSLSLQTALSIVIAILGCSQAAVAQQAGAAASAPAAVADSTSAPSADALAAGGASQTVYVTARHRREDAQNVPISLSVVSAAALTQTDSYTLQDVQQLVPNLVNYDVNARNSSLGIRGLGVTSAQDGMDTSVGVYIDNVYLGRPGMALADLIDVDRVEVLRGPQGTLFGRNSSAGVVNIATNEPSFTAATSAEVSLGDFTYNQEALASTGPLIDDVAAYRLTAYNTYRGGTIDDTKTGGTDNGIERGGARLQLLIKPADGISLRLIGDYSVEDDSEDTDVVEAVLPASLAATVARAEQALALTGWNPIASDTTTAINSIQDIRTRQGGVSGELDWQLGWGSLTSITAYRFWQFEPLQDSDGTPLDIFEVNAANTDDDQVTQEFRVASNEGVFAWQAGAFLFDQDLHDHYVLHQYGYDTAAYYTDYARLANPAAPAVIVAPGSQYIDNVATSSASAAAFGQANWSLTERLTLTGGLRYTYDHRTGLAGTTTLGAIPASLATPFAYDLSVDGHNLSSLGGISYRILPGSLLYASYSTGYKAAGLNLDSASVPAGGLIVKPETDASYEVGLKPSLLDGRLDIDADLYWTNLQGLQANYYPPSGAKSYVTNVGDIRARGAELDSRLTAGSLTLHIGAAYSDAVYTSYPNAPCPVEVSALSCSLTGLPVYEAPKWNASATARYDFARSARWQPYALAQYYYTASYFGTIDDSQYTRVRSYGITGARIGARNDRYDLTLWVKNAFDKVYFTSLALGSVNAPWGVEGLPGDPRTFGITLRAEL